jgi:hypothetical protein
MLNVYRMVFFTNNHTYAGLSHPRLDIVPLEGCAHAVIRAARDKIHLGWRLAHHPLYGNIRPHLQPFRSLLLMEPEEGAAVDPLSLRLIEEALAIYEAEKGRLPLPGSIPASLEADCAFLDRELLRETFAQAGINH